MIQPLRRAHRRWMVVLGLVLPPLLATVLASRPSQTTTRPLAEPILGAKRNWAPLGSWIDLRGSLAGRARTVRAGSTTGIDVDLDRPLAYPAVLAYWSVAAANLIVEDGRTPLALAADAVLVGEIVGQYSPSMPLPESLPAGPGRLILYSLGHGEIVGYADLELP